MPLIANHLDPVEHRGDSTTVDQSDAEGMNDMNYESSSDIIEERNEDLDGPMKALQPPGSDKRVSALIESVMMDLQNMDRSESKESQVAEQQSMISQDPHEMYLSSEEDASESADEYEGSLLEFDQNGEPISPIPSRQSQEATARVVSITLMQKPQIVEIIHHSNQSCRNHSTQSSIDSTNQPLDTIVVSRRRSNRSSSISISRRYSIASTISSFISPQPTLSAVHPPRKSSRLANLPSLLTKQSQSFRNNDIYSAPASNESNYPPLEPVQWDTPIETPKTPSSRPTSAWKRTLSRARYPSMPKMNLAYMASGAMPGDLRAAKAAALEEKEEMIKEYGSAQAHASPTAPLPTVSAEKNGPVKYGDIIKNAIKVPPPPPAPATKGLKAAIFNGKRKSLRR